MTFNSHSFVESMAAESPVMMPLNNFVGEDTSFYRSGSAPPTVEGSLNAINELNSSEIGSDPDYLSYYYNSVTRNPRMPPPVLSKEDWRSRQRFGGIEHNRNLSQNLGVNSSRNIGRNDNVWVSGDGLLGLSLPNQGSLTGFLQDDNNQSTSNPHYSFLPASHDAYETNNVNHYSETRIPIHTERTIQNSELQNKTSQSFASGVTPPPLNRTSELVESGNLVAALGKLNLSSDVSETSQLTFLRELRNFQSQISRCSNPSHSSNSSFRGPSNPSNFPSHAIDSRLYARAGGSAASLYQDYDTNELNGYSINPNLIPAGNLPPLLESAVNASSIAAFTRQTNVTDHQYIQFLKMLEYTSLTEQSYFDLLKMRQYGSQFLGNNGYNLNTSYPSKPVRHTEHHLHFKHGMANYFGGGNMGSRTTNVDGSIKECFPSSLLEEFKINKTKYLELSDIAGSAIEFSTDQLGSRFIQHKLDTATVEEVNMLFKEIMPQALALMTDVFGNYVIQKLFERGSSQQIRELTSKLYGNVLDLSLQMYGCRVIQKAIETVDSDQQAKMAAEFDGHIIRCVRDQNGNHVIQKCIQCIPEEAIQFIISSFYDNIITLSTHPYGCRVIQRVLEHCNDPKTQKIVIDEVMKCVTMLAWDQYGNYVVQHVVEHGKPHERSAIIKQLVGQIVQMSQQKYASNVVEKCLTFSTPDEHQILVNEMLGTTNDNEPLQVMMKDQFGNYVVQKALETCNDKQRQLILSRIKVHLTVLKKYTYGKHIVARVEKLLAAGERRNALQSANHLNTA